MRADAMTGTAPGGAPRRRRRADAARGSLAALAAGLALLGPPRAASAHDGPPYEVLAGVPVGGRLLDLWTDPDIGTGTYFLVLSAPEGGPPVRPPDELRVCVAPRSGAHPETCWPASAEKARRGENPPLDYFAAVEFPEGGWWTTRVLVRDGERVEVASVDVEVTPPGLGAIDFVIYLFPFVAFGLIFLKLAIKRRRLRRRAQAP